MLKMHTVKSFTFVDTRFRGLMAIEMFVDTFNSWTLN